MRKTGSKTISSPQKLSQYMSQKLLILGDPLCPGNTYKLQIKSFCKNLIPVKIHCYFCKVYKVTVTKQLKFLYLIKIYEKYCNSKKMFCDDTNNLLSSVSTSSLLACFMKKKEFMQIKRILDDAVHPDSFQLWHLSSLEKISII